MKRSAALIAVALMACVGPPLLPGALASDAEPSVSIPEGAPVQDALAELHRATGMLVLAEKSRVEHRLGAAIENAAPSDALSAITTAYHLHAMMGRRSVLFVRRLWDPKEPLDLPQEEITSIVSGLRRLIDPLSPHLAAPTPVQDALSDSLTKQQIAAARAGLLRVADLSPQQQQGWAAVEGDLLFGDRERELRQLETLFAAWKHVSLDWGRGFGPPRGRMAELNLRWETPEGQLGRWLYQGLETELAGGGGSTPAMASRPSIEALPADSRGMTRCPAAAGSFPEPDGLGDILDRIGRANGVSIEAPAWALDRQFFLFVSGHSGDEALQGLAQLNGWTIRSPAPDRFVLERPRVSPPNDYADYYRKVRLLVPPVLRVLAPKRRPGGDWYANPREVRTREERRLIAQEAARLAPHRESVVLASLAPPWQRRIANVMAEGPLLEIVGRDLADQPLKPWLATPEQCHFRLEGSDANPMITFEFSLTLPDGASYREGFGWIVRSHELLPKVP